MTTTETTRAAALAIARAELAEAEFCLRNLPAGIPAFLRNPAVDRVLACRETLRRLEVDA